MRKAAQPDDYEDTPEETPVKEVPKPAEPKEGEEPG